MTGCVLGTPAYMAPEQASGQTRRVGPAADVYSLGAILYELLTGRAPFRGASSIEVLDQVRFQKPVRPRRLQPEVPAALEAICLRCLEKQAEERYTSAAALRQDLRLFLAGAPPATCPPRGARCGAALATAVLAMTVFGAVTWWRFGGPGDAPPYQPEKFDTPRQVVPVAAHPRTRGDRFALLVGVREYRLKHYQCILKYTEEDVDELARVLHRDGGYARENIRILSQWAKGDNPALAPAVANIRAQLRDFLSERIEADTVIVGLTGSGLNLGDAHAYFFLPEDADFSVPTSMLGLSELYEMLSSCPARHKLLLIDTCQVARQLQIPPVPAVSQVPTGVAAIFRMFARPGESGDGRPETRNLHLPCHPGLARRCGCQPGWRHRARRTGSIHQ